MYRIFVSLSLLPVVLVLSTMAVGWWIGDYNGLCAQVATTPPPSTPEDVDRYLEEAEAILSEPRRRFNIHFQMGLASSLTVVLINSLSVTYLIGTSRWVKEVCEAYGLKEAYHEESARLKRKTFPWSIIGVAAILAIVAFGAAADPGTGRAGTANWVNPHMLTAIMGTCCIVWAIVVQGTNLHRNAAIIEQVAEQVKKERLARGLPVEAT